MNPLAPVEGIPGEADSNGRSPPGALGEPGVRRLGASVGDLHRAEQLLLEPVRVALVELLVGRAEAPSAAPMSSIASAKASSSSCRASAVV